MSRALRIMYHEIIVEQLMFWRNRSNLFFTFLFPLALLVFFGSFTNNNDVLVPGIAALGIVAVAFQSLAIQLSMHRDQGVLKRIMATPLPSWQLIAGKVVSVTIVLLIELALVIALGKVAFHVALPHDLLLFFAAVFAGTLCFVALGFAVASAISNADSAPAVTNAIYLPMMFVSGVFYPVSVLPEWAQVIAKVLPMHHLVVPLGAAWSQPTQSPWPHILVLLVWGAAGMVYTVRRFRWEPAWER